MYILSKKGPVINNLRLVIPTWVCSVLMTTIVNIETFVIKKSYSYAISPMANSITPMTITTAPITATIYPIVFIICSANNLLTNNPATSKIIPPMIAPNPSI